MIIEYANQLAEFSEPGQGVTRTFLSKEHRQAIGLLQQWMQRAGMSTEVDDMANLIGHYHVSDHLPTLVLGSHQDTVREGGRFDGMLGIILPIVCLQSLNDRGINIPFNVDVIAFGDEEGVRFETTYLGSRAIAKQFDMNWLDKTDQKGTSIRQALQAFGLRPDNIPNLGYERQPVAYIEVHIEQGPVLEEQRLPVGVVTAIVGLSRYRITLEGLAGHAGTVPMAFRQDAGAGAAACISAAETLIQSYPEAVATVASVEFFPGAINVIPGKATFTLDIRAPTNEIKEAAYREIAGQFAEIAGNRHLQIDITSLFATDPCQCDDNVIEQLHHSIEAVGVKPFQLPSGAGHDAQAMHAIAPVGMLFVRCKAGISHNPAEDITAEDAQCAADIICHFLQNATLS